MQRLGFSASQGDSNMDSVSDKGRCRGSEEQFKWENLTQLCEHFATRLKNDPDVGKCIFECTECIVGDKARLYLTEIKQSSFPYYGYGDFDAVFSILNPINGLLFEKLQQLLLQYPHFRYVVSVASLPLGLRTALKLNLCSGLLRARLNSNTQTLSLLPHEWFWFSFCKHFLWSVGNAKLACGFGQAQPETGSVFHSLLEAYFNYYLSDDCQAEADAHKFREALTKVGGGNTPLLKKGCDSGDAVRTPLNLLKKSWMMSTVGGFAVSDNIAGRSRVDFVCKAESMVQIMADFLLASPAASNEQTLADDGSSPSLSLTTVPMVMVIRTFLKYIIRFAFSPNQAHPAVVDFRGTVISRYIQKPLYCFLKASMLRWPMDGSFLYLLETWLSWLQPWRYALGLKFSGRLDESWDGYFYDNFLLFATVYKLLLSRFLRLDISDSRNAFMVYRFVKVISMERFMAVMREIDSVLKDLRNHVPDAGNVHMMHLHRHVVALESGLILEGGYGHGIFGADSTKEVYDLLVHIQTALVFLRQREEVEELECERRRRERKQKMSNWLFFVVDNLGLGEAGEPDGMERQRRTEDWKKCSGYLQYCLYNLSQLFSITPPQEISNLNASAPYPYSPCSSFNSSYGGFDLDLSGNDLEPDFEVDPNSGALRLSSLGKFQVLNQLRRTNLDKVVVSGPRDTLIPQSNEFAPLVKVANFMSCVINDFVIGRQRVQEWYYSSGMNGKIAKYYLQPPTLTQVKSKTAVSAKLENLPPRISFRFIASYKFLLQLMIFILIMWLSSSPGKCIAFVLGWHCLMFAYFCITMESDD